MNYPEYLAFLRRNGTEPTVSEKLPQLRPMFSDDYMRKALVTKLVAERIIEEPLANILLTKSLINNYF